MEDARLGSPTGRKVTPMEFHRIASSDYKKKGVFAYCNVCGEVVHPYGVHTPNPVVQPRFDHADRKPGADPLDDCIRANRNDPRFKGLPPDEWDEERGQAVRDEFFQPESLARAYNFCLDLCRKGHLPFAKFRSMLSRADKKHIWAYVDIPVWSIPYILLTLENFTGKKAKDGREYEFHFIFQKPSGSNISALWKESARCSLLKVFSNGGKPVEAEDNPYPVAEQALITKAGNFDWIITSDVLHRLMV